MRKHRLWIVAASACLVARASAGQSASWEPGERTTATVAGEVGEPSTGGEGDGVYGRFDGDLDLGLGAGVEVGEDAGRGAARLSLAYFSTLALALSYADSLGDDGAPIERIASAELEVRPTFIARWSKNMQQGPAWIDLMLDSFALGVGAFAAEAPGRSFGALRGLELSGGFGVPLTGTAAGPWIEGRGLLRWPDPGRGPSERAESALLATLSWHTTVLSPSAARGQPLSE